MSTSPAPAPGLAGITVFTLLLAAAQMPLGSTLIAVALPSMGTSLAIDPILVTSVLVTSYLVVNLVSQGPGGKLGDLFGHQRVLWIGIALFTLSAVVGLLAPGLPLLVLSRCLMAAARAARMRISMKVLLLPDGSDGGDGSDHQTSATARIGDASAPTMRKGRVMRVKRSTSTAARFFR